MTFSYPLCISFMLPYIIFFLVGTVSSPNFSLVLFVQKHSVGFCVSISTKLAEFWFWIYFLVMFSWDFQIDTQTIFYWICGNLTTCSPIQNFLPFIFSLMAMAEIDRTELKNNRTRGLACLVMLFMISSLNRKLTCLSETAKISKDAILFNQDAVCLLDTEFYQMPFSIREDVLFFDQLICISVPVILLILKQP